MTAPDVVARWKTAAENRDAAALVECMAEDVELVSPLTAVFRFKGKAQLHDVFASVYEVIWDIHYHTELGEGSNWALFFNAQATGVALEEAQLLRLDEAGLIRELTLFSRPLPAVTQVMAGIVPRLLHRQGRDRYGPLVAAAVNPIAFLTKQGDQRLAPLLDPSRGKPLI